VYVTDAEGAGNKVTTVPFAESEGAVNTYPIALLKDSRTQPLRRFPSTFPHLSSGVAGYDYQVRRRGGVA
jgi:molybdate transport system substrate-binding protein